MNSWRQSLYHLGLGLGSMLFAYQVWTGYQAVGLNSAQFVSPPLLVGAVGLGIAVNPLQFGIWAYLMHGLGVNIPWWQTVKGYTLSMLVRYIPGGIWGYLSRSHWLYRNYGVPYEVSNAGSVLEVFGLIVAAGVIAGGYWGVIAPDRLRWVLLSLTVFSPLGVWLVMHELLKRPLFQWLSHRELLAVAFLKMPLRRWLTIVALYVVLWIDLGGTMLLVIHALDLSPRGGILETTFVFAAAWFVGFLFIFVPAGLGIRELVLSSLMTTTLGIMGSLATAASVVMRFAISATEAVYLLGVMLIEIVSSARK